MMNGIFRSLSALLSLIVFSVQAQEVKKGFDRGEYERLMKISAQFGDSSYASALPPPEGSKRIYRSAIMGLRNCWELWQLDNQLPVISIRGTTVEEMSWLANFYAAMVPAKGSIQLSATERFNYSLSEDPKAAVHAGWLIATGFLSKDMLPKIDSMVAGGRRSLLIIGHSQGGAIAYLLTAYLRGLQAQGRLPSALTIKTYCSAGPKPGNFYFAHSYEAASGQWAFNVVNPLDWVPQTPFSVQTLEDMAASSPFNNARGFIRKSKWPKRWIMSIAYKKLANPARKTQRRYEKFLGKFVAKSVRKALPGFVEPEYAPTSDYVRTGNTISLVPTAAYFSVYPQDASQPFQNHFHGPYLFLLNANFPVALDGAWQLSWMGEESLSQLFPETLPSLNFNGSMLEGYSGCNSIKGNVMLKEDAIQFPESFTMTKRFCAGGGEAAFLKALKDVDHFTIREGELFFLDGGATILRFVRKLP